MRGMQGSESLPAKEVHLEWQPTHLNCKSDVPDILKPGPNWPTNTQPVPTGQGQSANRSGNAIGQDPKQLSTQPNRAKLPIG